MEQINAAGETIQIVHFVFQTEPERVACMPAMTELHRTPYHPSYLRSNDPRGVSCPACKRTDQYKQAIDALFHAIAGRKH